MGEILGQKKDQALTHEVATLNNFVLISVARWYRHTILIRDSNNRKLGAGVQELSVLSWQLL